MQRILLTAVSVRHTHSILSKQKEGEGEAKGEGGATALSKCAAVASGYWSSGGLALLIWFTNRTRRPPHIVTHYYYYSQTLAHSHTHSHTRTHSLAVLCCHNAFGKRIWYICFIYCVVCRILIAFAHTHTHTYTHSNGRRTHTHTDSGKSLSICNLNARHHRLGPFPAHSMRLFDS